MPLIDHFHPPVSERRNWEGFHSLWAAAIVEKLNRDVLSADYFADMQVHIGSQVEVDIATFEERASTGISSAAAIATKPAPTWTPPKTALVMPAAFPDEIEVQVFSTSAGPTLVAAIELVSPANKDRPESRRAFAAKCQSYLARGVGLIVVDVVTNRLANLHNELVELFNLGQAFAMTPAIPTYAVAYRPSRQPTGDQIELWPVPLAIDESLPTLPLALLNAGMVPVDLEETYSEARQRGRL
jgi:hypothetical protein